MSIQYTDRFVSRLTKNTLALVLAGGRGSRLKDLTLWRAKPAVPFGGRFRIIDFTLSNCMNSGVRRVGILTQYKSHSLHGHIHKGWGYLRGELGEFIEVLPAQQRVEDKWYSGTANAVYQNLDIVNSHSPDYVLILSGDHVYKMDYGPMLAFHVENCANLTVGCSEVPLSQAKSFGVIGVGSNSLIRSFIEKPDQPEPTPGSPDVALVSMGIYVFNTGFLIEQLRQDAKRGEESSHDFGRDIIPSSIGKDNAFAYPFRTGTSGANAYWRDVGTIDSYWQANLELIGVSPELNLYDKEWPVWTYQEQTPPAKFVFNEKERRGIAVDSMISGGSIISGAQVSHSLLFDNVCVEAYTTIEDSVILPEVAIGKNCHIKRAVIDKKTVIPDNVNIGFDKELDGKRFYISPGGVVLVTPEMLGQNLHSVY